MLEKKSDAGGYTTAYYYDRGGRLIAEVSPQNYQEGQSLSSLNRVEYTYDSMNRLKQTRNIYRDPENGQWRTVITKTYEYDANGNITKETDALGNATTYSYNLANQLIQVLDPVSQERGLSFSTKYEYDTMGRKIAETNGNGVVTGYTYDNVGNLLQKTIAGNVVETNTYDYLGNLLSRTDGNGNTTVYSYNALGKVRQVEEPGDESIASLTTTYQYDVKGNLAQKENSLGRVELYTYDNQNRVLTKAVRKNDGTETITKTYRYDVNGNRCVETDGNGNVTQNTYDVLNRLVATAKNGQTTSYTYDANGNLLTETDWLGNTNTNVYDPINRLIERHNPYCRIEKLKYNDNNAQVESMDALGQVTRFEYDQNNRLIETIDPAGYSTSQTYDNAGNIATKTDGNGNTTSYTYDWGNRPLTVTNAKNETTAYTYDLNGNMTSQQDGKGNVTTYMYNARNLLKAKIDPQGAGNPARTETYTYYADSNRQTMVDRNGKTTAYYYDIHGRLIRKVGGLNTANAETISYTYDNNGNQLTVSDRTGTTVREYDGFDRVISKTVPGIGTTTYQYDVTAGLENGFVAEIAIDPKGNRTQKTYDKAGRLKYVTADGQSTVYNYYDNGNRQSVIYPDGTREEYQYYSNNKLYQLKNTAANGTVLDIYTYTYDAAGNQTSKHEIINGVEKGTTTYAYDALNRLEQVTEPNGRVTTYTYDAAGNRAKETITANGQTVENTYTYNEQNRLTGIVTRTNGAVTETTTYTYDNNGNQLTVTKNGVLCTENTYDVFNQLIETESNGTTVTNTYNGEGLRVAKEVDGEKTQYLYEYDKIVLEVDERGNATARNVYGLNLLKRTVDGESYYYLYNGHADVTALVDATTGNIATTYYYDAFGNILEQTGNVNNFITYAGYQYDEETGLYYLNARMYDPKIGRFLQEDTYWGDATDPLSLNLYTYCANNPLVYYDPSGHAPEWLEKLWKGTKTVGKKIGSDVAGIAVGAGEFAYETGVGLITLGTETVGAITNPLVDASVSGLHGIGLVSDDTANRVKKNLAYDRAQRGEFFSQLPTNFLTSTKESFNKMLELPRNLVDLSKNWRDVADSTKGTLNIAGTVYGGVKLVSGFAKAGTSIAKTSTSIFDNMGWQPATVGGYGSNISGWGNLKAAVIDAGKDVGTASLLNMSKLKSTDSGSGNLNKMQGLVDEGSAGAGNKAIVIGEGMEDIKTVAKQLQSKGVNAKWYQAWSKNFPSGRRMTQEEMSSALARNKRWIESKVKQGYEIYDIGSDMKRLERSPFYELEQQVLHKYNYPTKDIRRLRP